MYSPVSVSSKFADDMEIVKQHIADLRDKGKLPSREEAAFGELTALVEKQLSQRAKTNGRFGKWLLLLDAYTAVKAYRQTWIDGPAKLRELVATVTP